MTGSLSAALRYERARPIAGRAIVALALLLVSARLWPGVMASLVVFACAAIGFEGVRRDDYLRSRPIARGVDLRAQLTAVALHGAWLGVAVALVRTLHAWSPAQADSLSPLVLGAAAGMSSFVLAMLFAVGWASTLVDRAVPFGLDRVAPLLAGTRDLVTLSIFVAGTLWFQQQDFGDPVAACGALGLALAAGAFVVVAWYVPTRSTWIARDFVLATDPNESV